MSVTAVVLDLLQEVQQAQLNRAARRFEISPQEVEAIVRDADPTPKMKYGTWLLKHWLAHPDPMNLRDETISDEVKELLAVHDRLVKLGRAEDWDVKSNLFDYKSWREVWGALQEIPEGALLSRRQLKRGKADPLSVPGSELVGEEGDYRVYLVTTPDAAMFHGRGTQWCTRARDSACHYAKASDPLIIAHRNVVYGGRRQGKESWEPQYQATSDFREVQDEEHNELVHDDLPYEVQELFREAAIKAGTVESFDEWAKASEGGIENAWNTWIEEEYRKGLIEKFNDPDLTFEIEQLAAEREGAIDALLLYQLFRRVIEDQDIEIITTWYGDDWDVEVDVEEVVDQTSRQEIRFAFDPSRRAIAAQYQQQELPLSGAAESLKAEVYGILVA